MVKNKLPFVFVAVILLAAITAAVIFTGDEKNKQAQAPKNNAIVSACGPYRRDKIVKIDGQTINVELPKNTAEFSKGLAGRPCILPDQGMLFAFSKPGQYSFWMKGMKFPIDIVWITPDHKVAAIEIDFKPSTYPERRANQIPAQYVLELKANRSKELRMDIGTPVSF